MLKAASLVAASAIALLSSQAHAGHQFNGHNMNGHNMNGHNMNGHNMNGVSLNGVSLNGHNMNGVQLSGTNLVASVVDVDSSCGHSQVTAGAPLAGCSPCAQIVDNGDPYCGTTYWDGQCVSEAQAWCSLSGASLVNAQFSGTRDDGGTVTLRLDGVRAAPAAQPGDPDNSDIVLYAFSWLTPAHFEWIDIAGRPHKIWLVDSWTPLCASTDRDGLFNQAIPVAGHWADCQGPGCGGKISNDGFALACRDVGAIAKCVERVGYKPWKTGSNGLSLDEPHQACVRMLRADYCGNGVPHTNDGTQIDVYDYPTSYGVETQVGNVSLGWNYEAEWSKDGAVCENGSRWSDANPAPYTNVKAYIQATCPQIMVPNLATSDCAHPNPLTNRPFGSIGNLVGNIR